MRTKQFQISALFLSLFIMTCCSSDFQTFGTKSKGVDLKKYKSYAWVKTPNTIEPLRVGPRIYESVILDASNEALQKKNMVINTENPDAIFLFYTKLEERIAYSQAPTTTVGVGVGGPGYYGGAMVPVAGGEITARKFQEGMLFIEMYDTNTGKLLWRGGAEEDISQKADLEDDIRKAIKQIFLKLPVYHSKQ